MIETQQQGRDAQIVEGVILLVMALSATLAALRAGQKAVDSWRKAMRTLRGAEEQQGNTGESG